MAKVIGAFHVAHSPYCYMPVEKWNESRARRVLREDVPFDDLEENQRKAARVQQGFATVRQKLHEAKPDVLVIFGNDQLEAFRFNNFPSFMVYVGDEFAGPTSVLDGRGRGPDGERLIAPMAKLKGHPELAKSILTGVMKSGFDPAFAMTLPSEERGLGHAIMRPAESLTNYNIPAIPIMLNCYYTPQVTAKRCYEFGKAVREAIEADPRDLRVAVIGSGGLWHTPGAKNAYLNEEFDQGSLKYLEAGDIRGMAEHFDSYHIPEDDRSQDIEEYGRESTGMLSFGGPQSGTRETCNWITAAAVVDGNHTTIVDYVPIYASPIGAAFAYCDKV